ncbi:peptidyl-dipeptidase Dcp [Bryocella elongata]|uniref:peptidyl-dipeptidase Dcp n=1 Tax=Bryocella elongata TaxID=863522 RepID=UPI001F263663|nr:peptidyl-dipeptidase Dcp [Bryocella elongata]
MAEVTVAAAAMLAASGAAAQPQDVARMFGPQNPFYAESKLPFQAPDFAHIHDTDYPPAIEAGMTQQRHEWSKIAHNSAPPTFDNTLVALERSGVLLNRVLAVFNGLAGANTNPVLQKMQELEAPRLAAHSDALYLDAKLFARVETLYNERASLKLNDEQARLLDQTYLAFVHAGAKLSEADKTKLKRLNEEEATLSSVFVNKLLAATKAAAYATSDKAALAGLSEAELHAAELAAKERKTAGYVVQLQNTTQQPDLALLSDRTTRAALFNDSWTRAERGGENDTRATVARLAEVRAEKAALLGKKSYAAWALETQMAKTPEAALKFMDDLVPAATAKAHAEAAEIQKLIDAQKGGFQLEAWDWNFYAEQVRKAKYDLDESQVKPYFEINRVLEDGVFYAATQLYGITFKERHDIPVYNPDVRVFEVFDVDGKPLALFYTDYYKRDNKNGGAWMDQFVGQSKLLGTLPVVFNVANFAKAAPGQPQLLSFDDVTTMFHEFGHALHGLFSNVEYPSLSGTNVPRDFVEFPSQFNEHWATQPQVFAHFARHYQTGEPMPQELAAKLKQSAGFNQGYGLTELLAAAELDMQWHTIPAGQPVADVDAFERAALEKTKLALKTVPPRYRSSYFMHVWGNGYAAGYYAYLWAEMLDDDAYQWFEDNGGLTRANGDRFRSMVLSRGNSEDLGPMYERWLGGKPSVAPMLKQRGLTGTER